jgi:hypothetical protein
MPREPGDERSKHIRHKLTSNRGTYPMA